MLRQNPMIWEKYNLLRLTWLQCLPALEQPVPLISPQVQRASFVFMRTQLQWRQYYKMTAPKIMCGSHLSNYNRITPKPNMVKSLPLSDINSHVFFSVLSWFWAQDREDWAKQSGVIMHSCWVNFSTKGYHQSRW